ncbi:hypothetical protein LTR66_002022 [Elasticomyces elasticus]|nr:hypothetical protein LTR66_002022 [Elasticomyces elasticus]
MDLLSAPILYREARLNIEPTTSSSILTLTIPSTNTSLLASTSTALTRSRKAIASDEHDVASFQAKHLALESSVFFKRNRDASPRTFLWRVLDDRRVLELQALDLVQAATNTEEGIWTVSIRLPERIQNNGIAFVDSETESQALDVFVLTETNEVLSLSLGRDAFVKGTKCGSNEEILKRTLRRYSPTTLAVHLPFKLMATNPRQCYVSLHHGGLLRLDREGYEWQQTTLHQGSWSSSLRGLLPWKGHDMIRYDHSDLDPTAASALALSPDGSHLITVSLDHKLRAWNLRTGKIGIQTDILGYNEPDANGRPPQPYFLNPEQGQLMQVITVQGLRDDDTYYITTYSPKNHEFKFWAVRDANDALTGFEDVQPNAKLVPPFGEPDFLGSGVWQVEDFHVAPGAGWRDSLIWVRVRSGQTCRIYSLTFDLIVMPVGLADTWATGWAGVGDGPLTAQALKTHPAIPTKADMENIGQIILKEMWLDFLLYPGRFTDATLETALFAYVRSSDPPRTASTAVTATKQTPFKERLLQAVSSGASNQCSDQNERLYLSNLQTQWDKYFSGILDLHKRRGDSLALAFDPVHRLAWSVRADIVAPIRSCSDVEIVLDNADLLVQDLADSEDGDSGLPKVLAQRSDIFKEKELACLLSAASAFWARRSQALKIRFREAAVVDALTESSTSLSDRISTLFEITGYHEDVSDEEYEKLLEFLEPLGGMGSVDNQLIESALQYGLEERQQGQIAQLALTRYGAKLTVAGAQEFIELGSEVLMDVLALVVFMAMEAEEDQLSEDFEAEVIFAKQSAKLKQCEALKFLAKNVRQNAPPRKKHNRRTSSIAASTTGGDDNDPSASQTSTLLESIFIGDWPELFLPQTSMLRTLAYWVRAWPLAIPLEQLYDGIAAHIFASLLKDGNHDLAREFMRFLPETLWVTYLKGRLYLAVGEYGPAMIAFTDASHDLSVGNGPQGQGVEELDSCNFLSSTERSFFFSGLVRYYQHIISLFETQRVWSYVIDVAEICLRQLAAEADNGVGETSFEELDRRKSKLGGGPAERVGLAMEEIKMLRIQERQRELFDNLYHAAMKTNRFEVAHSALAQLPDPEIRTIFLRGMIQALLRKQEVSILLTLPFTPSLAKQADGILYSICKGMKTLPPADHPGSDHHKVLYAFRIQRHDFRGAASALYMRLQLLRDLEDDTAVEEDVLDTYLLLINTLACCGKEDGWILADGAVHEQPQRREGGLASKKLHFGKRDGKDASAQDSTGRKKAKRHIVTLEDVRREYAAELDRRSEIEAGRFAFGGRMDLDVM